MKSPSNSPFPPMNKVLVIGSPGSGKSTFALRLHEITGLPLYHLDNLYWRADRTFIEKDELRQRVAVVLEEDSWIIDGNYGSTMAMRMEHSDTIIFLDYDVEICLESIVARVGKVRVDIPWVEEELDPEFYEYVKNFPQLNRPSIYDLLAQHEDQTIVILKNRDESEAYLQALEKQVRPQRAEPAEKTIRTKRTKRGDCSL